MRTRPIRRYPRRTRDRMVGRSCAERSRQSDCGGIHKCDGRYRPLRPQPVDPEDSAGRFRYCHRLYRKLHWRFNAQISIRFSGLATGMNWSVIGANTANNLVSVVDSFTASKSTPLGTYPVTITATGSGISHSAVVQITVTRSVSAS